MLGHILKFGLFCLFTLCSYQTAFAQCVKGDCKNGEGVLVYDSGTRYEGKFLDGQPYGKGVMYYANGNKYEGQFKVFPKGEGTFYYADGTKQSGVWDKNTLVKDLNCIKGDCKDGQGTYEFPNGDTYEGEWANGKRSGLGIMRFANGSKYVGDFHNDEYGGEGTLYQTDGTELTGMWRSGELVTDFDSRGDRDLVKEENEIANDLNPKGGSELPENVVTNPTVDEVKAELEEIEINPDNMKVWAVIVGVSDYNAMPKLNYTDDDAYQVYAFLKSPEGGALPDEQVRVLIDASATRDRIEETMRETFSKAGENDVIFLYFSGHGLKGAFLPIDYTGKKNKLHHASIRQILDESPAKFKICIADACHSGSLASARSMKSVAMTLKNYYDAFSTAKAGTALLLSSKSEEISLESNGLRQGIFSHFLIRGLKGEADVDQNKIVTIKELHTYVSAQVNEFTAEYQTPVIQGDYDNKMPVGVVRY